MEWLKQMSLKKSLFVIALIHIAAALLLSAAAFWGCVEAVSRIAPQGSIFVIPYQASGQAAKVGETGAQMPDTAAETGETGAQMPDTAAQAGETGTPASGTAAEARARTTGTAAETGAAASAAGTARTTWFLSLLQLALPVLICILALISTTFTFYRLKLKTPLAALSDGATRIIENDLDFTIEAGSADELGLLCTAFETMRATLLENNRKLWRQAEERRRLNAAFAHNLQNPVTVLLGAAKLSRKELESGSADPAQLAGQLSLMEHYTKRIQDYIGTMSSVQRLEEIPLARKGTDWNGIVRELNDMMQFLGSGSKIQPKLETVLDTNTIFVDSSVLFQIAENLVSNAFRFARQRVLISCSVTDGILLLSVTDDGGGFPDLLIREGIRPFQKGKEEAGHFGMGLYISSLLAKKHGGSLTIQNIPTGAVVTATLKTGKS